MSCFHPNGDKQYYAVELVDNLGFEGGHADKCHVQDGIVMLTNGDLPNVSIVAAWASGRWVWVAPMDCPHDDGDDDE